MTSQPLDTHQEIEEVQIALIRKASVSKRISLLRSLSQTAIQLSRRAINRANPDLTEEELKYKILEHHYGTELTERHRNHFDSNYP